MVVATFLNVVVLSSVILAESAVVYDQLGNEFTCEVSYTSQMRSPSENLLKKVSPLFYAWYNSEGHTLSDEPVEYTYTSRELAYRGVIFLQMAGSNPDEDDPVAWQVHGQARKQNGNIVYSDTFASCGH